MDRREARTGWEAEHRQGLMGPGDTSVSLAPLEAPAPGALIISPQLDLGILNWAWGALS